MLIQTPFDRGGRQQKTMPFFGNSFLFWFYGTFVRRTPVAIPRSWFDVVSVDFLSLVGALIRTIPRRNVIMTIVFDEACEWDGSFLTGWANRKGERIRCQAGRASIAKLAGFTEASSYQIGMRKQMAFELLKKAFTQKIERGEFDESQIKGITLSIHDLTEC